MIPHSIADASTGIGAEVTDERELVATWRGYPPLGEQKIKPFRQFLINSAASNDMAVDGSSTNVDFFVEAKAESDLYITYLSFVISDAGAALNEFGNISALSNGGRIFHQ